MDISNHSTILLLDRAVDEVKDDDTANCSDPDTKALDTVEQFRSLEDSKVKECQNEKIVISNPAIEDLVKHSKDEYESNKHAGSFEVRKDFFEDPKSNDIKCYLHKAVACSDIFTEEKAIEKKANSVDKNSVKESTDENNIGIEAHGNDNEFEISPEVPKFSVGYPKDLVRDNWKSGLVINPLKSEVEPSKHFDSDQEGSNEATEHCEFGQETSDYDYSGKERKKTDFEKVS